MKQLKLNNMKNNDEIAGFIIGNMMLIGLFLVAWYIIKH